jgi:hypothetical protein
METISTKTRVSDDARLIVPVPGTFRGSEVEVVIVMQKTNSGASPESLGWPPGFFEEVCGSIQDENFHRWPQGEAEPAPVLE